MSLDSNIHAGSTATRVSALVEAPFHPSVNPSAREVAKSHGRDSAY